MAFRVTVGGFVLKTALNYKVAIKAVSVLIPVLFAGSSAAQNAVAPAVQKWRPKDGIYAAPGKGFAASCDEANNIAIELTDKSVSGNEWSCRVTNILDPDPSSIKVEMTCSDYNLAEFINRPEGTQFKEILLLKRIDPGTISVHKSSNGKFKYPAWRAAYCPEATQRSYVEAKLRDKSVARQKVEQERTLKSAHPRDGVYAAAGADFEGRCAKFNDTIVSFSGKSITTASNTCRSKIHEFSFPTPSGSTLPAHCKRLRDPKPSACRTQTPFRTERT